jgi:ribose 5-phosphate isomerase A
LATKPREVLAEEKRRAAEVAALWVPDGVLLGLGSGTTVVPFVERLGERIRTERLRVRALPTSQKSRQLAAAAGIPLLEPSRGLRLDLTVDGADELDPSLTLLKGGGGALLREKLVARASRYVLIIGDSSKPVPVLGRFPLPLEVIPFAAPLVMDWVEDLGGAPAVREVPGSPGEPAVTDQGNWLLDCRFGEIPDPAGLAARLAELPGIVEHGLFLGLATAAVIADGDEVRVLRAGQPPVPAAGFAVLPAGPEGVGTMTKRRM